MTTSQTRGCTASLHTHALLCAAQGGDRRALEELLHRYEPLVAHAVGGFRRTSHTDSEDIAQEARLGLLAAIRAWQPARGPFPAFAARCVHNKVITALHIARTRKHEVLNQALSLDCAAPLVASRYPLSEGSLTRAGWQPPAHSDPVRDVLVRERLDAVRATWPTLSDKQRSVLAGVLNGRSYRQLATELDCTVKAIDGALRRARRNLTAGQPVAA
jgi:RNA polymerase sporulation-specific sigma factor